MRLRKTKQPAVSLPNRPVQFRDLQQALLIHQRRLARVGGPGEGRNTGRLLRALYRPRSGDHAGLTAMAAALFESLRRNHPVLNGTGRAALFIRDSLLWRNGGKPDAEPDAACPFRIGLVANTKTSITDFRPWIQTSIVPA